MCTIYTRATPLSTILAGMDSVKDSIKTLQDLLQPLSHNQKRMWSEHLAEVLTIHNSTLHVSTGYSHYYLLFETEAILSIDFTLNTKNDEGPTTVEEWLEGHLEKLRDVHLRTGQQMHKLTAEISVRKTGCQGQFCYR